MMTTKIRELLSTFPKELAQVIGDAETILDVGCGSSSPLMLLDRGYKRTVGVDGFSPSIEASRKRRIHDEYVQGDLLDIDRMFAPDAFECVISIDVVEHFEKEKALELIHKMEIIASKRVVIMTPNGFLPQDEHSGNIYQRHLSGWSVSEFESMGYQVIGINGWKYLRGEFAAPRFRPKVVFNGLSRLSQPFVRNNPEYAFHLLCVKDVSDRGKKSETA
ncbi:class I SAM-dependent methyltransferase [Candidatus Parcubacteria bacterium]|nr:MAG: class I SAM-dependent methyltransferase [Candidatus Parcubacteria bacterium]